MRGSRRRDHKGFVIKKKLAVKSGASDMRYCMGAEADLTTHAGSTSSRTVGDRWSDVEAAILRATEIAIEREVRDQA